MKKFDIQKVWPLLKRQVGSLHLPWLENMASRERDPFKILISCILSLRTQDRTTGKASERLFALAETPKKMAKLSVREIEKAIYPVGFYRVKAKRIKDMSREITEKYHSRVPDEIEELLKLKGVGRKTANLVVTLGYNKPGICVDTHVHRITNRWGYVKTKSPEETELALRRKLPKKYWKEINGLLVAFGQGICRPISPLCSSCDLNNFCAKLNVAGRR
ncbi:MAG: endonuclease III [Nitrospirae bacterium]|nr:endonuclease III [Nitrospirota bacterium]MCL5421673.1 endonuclease III [Nitrospirota bacterium]